MGEEVWWWFLKKGLKVFKQFICQEFWKVFFDYFFCCFFYIVFYFVEFYVFWGFFVCVYDGVVCLLVFVFWLVYGVWVNYFLFFYDFEYWNVSVIYQKVVLFDVGKNSFEFVFWKLWEEVFIQRCFWGVVNEQISFVSIVGKKLFYWKFFEEFYVFVFYNLLVLFNCFFCVGIEFLVCFKCYCVVVVVLDVEKSFFFLFVF